MNRYVDHRSNMSIIHTDQHIQPCCQVTHIHLAICPIDKKNLYIEYPYVHRIRRPPSSQTTNFSSIRAFLHLFFLVIHNPVVILRAAYAS